MRGNMCSLMMAMLMALVAMMSVETADARELKTFFGFGKFGGFRKFGGFPKFGGMLAPR